MNITKYLSFFLLVPLLAFTTHKYYISLCEVEYVEEQESVQIIIGLFIDDIEFTLNKDLKIGSELEIENIDELFEEYLNIHFKIIINKELHPYQFIGKEYDGDIVRFYLEITNIKEFKTLEVYNYNLIRDFQEQQNIIKINVNNVHKTFYLDKYNSNCLLKF